MIRLSPALLAGLTVGTMNTVAFMRPVVGRSYYRCSESACFSPFKRGRRHSGQKGKSPLVSKEESRLVPLGTRAGPIDQHQRAALLTRHRERLFSPNTSLTISSPAHRTLRRWGRFPRSARASFHPDRDVAVACAAASGRAVPRCKRKWLPRWRSASGRRVAGARLHLRLNGESGSRNPAHPG